MISLILPMAASCSACFSCFSPSWLPTPLPGCLLACLESLLPVPLPCWSWEFCDCSPAWPSCASACCSRPAAGRSWRTAACRRSAVPCPAGFLVAGLLLAAVLVLLRLHAREQILDGVLHLAHQAVVLAGVVGVLLGLPCFASCFYCPAGRVGIVAIVAGAIVAARPAVRCRTPAAVLRLLGCRRRSSIPPCRASDRRFVRPARIVVLRIAGALLPTGRPTTCRNRARHPGAEPSASYCARPAPVVRRRKSGAA